MNSKTEIKKMQPLLKKINALRDKYMSFSDEQMKDEALKLKKRRETESGEKLLPEAFALVREATRRVLGKEHYDVQILSGITLYKGRIAEAKTGEGKTITIYLPAFLSCLDGKGVHIVTVNDYLANRDAIDAAKVFEFLGFSVGCVLHTSTIADRQVAYNCDVTYVTNSELGFDYLKDHIAFDKRETVLRDFHYAIIDEVDSVLIDEAKTPLIISGKGPDVDGILQAADEFVQTLTEGVYQEVSATKKLLGEESYESGDYIKNEKEQRIYLTEKGITVFEKTFEIDDYNSANTLMIQRAVNNALRANYLMFKDKDYIVRDDSVEIIDTFTGRVLPGRRFSDGLHQALEVKEKVTVNTENLTIATVTFQSFFNKYTKKCGLTGTAMTSEKEFKDVYHMDIVEIPTHRPVIRKDLNDCVFRTKKEKWNAVLAEVKRTHETGQPVLIGTASVEDSEIISKILSDNNIEHNTLNAKNEALEADIIAMAGQFGAVTVATNMAGRGTDILLDEQAKAAGGLKVIGTERHDSRRIDNQLKGRSGRQGDPGVSQFYISLEDRVMRVFGDQNSLDMLMMIAAEPGTPLQYKPLTKIIEKAQCAVETENRLVREHMLKYDESDNEHREQIYSQRDEILCCENPREVIAEMFYAVADDIIDRHIKDNTPTEEWDVDGAVNEFFDKVTYVSMQLDVTGMKKEDFKVAFRKLCDLLIDMKEKQIGDSELAMSVEKSVMLRLIDRHWVTFLSSMAYVKQIIGNQSYAQRNPSMEYKKRGVELFNAMIEAIQEDIVFHFMRCQVRVDDQPPATENEE